MLKIVIQGRSPAFTSAALMITHQPDRSRANVSHPTAMQISVYRGVTLGQGKVHVWRELMKRFHKEPTSDTGYSAHHGLDSDGYHPCLIRVPGYGHAYMRTYI